VSSSEDTDAHEVSPPSEPLAVARQFIAERMTDDGFYRMRSHGGAFYAWATTCWPEQDERALNAELYNWLEDAVWEKV